MQRYDTRMQPWSTPILPKAVKLSGSLVLRDVVSQRDYEPIKNGKMNFYVCGITPYDSAHLGHLFTYLIFDVVNRSARALGADVTYVQNITDIDDPLFERARKISQTWSDLAESQILKFKIAMEKLKIIPPDVLAPVTEEIDIIINDTNKLNRKSYQIGTNVYFKSDIAHLKSFTRLSDENLMQFSSDRGGDPYTIGKHDPLDPKIWVNSLPDEPRWDSHYGEGRPGWHIECVSIAHKYFGETFDLQGGGADLLFPHHAFCDQLSREIFEQPLARGFVHTALVEYKGAKISKSLGNLVFLDDLINQGYSVDEIRLALLSQSWLRSWEYTDEIMREARNMLQRWRDVLSTGRFPGIEQVKAIFETFLLNGLDTKECIRVLDQAIMDAFDISDPAEAVDLIEFLLGVDLGKW